MRAHADWGPHVIGRLPRTPANSRPGPPASAGAQPDRNRNNAARHSPPAKMTLLPSLHPDSRRPGPRTPRRHLASAPFYSTPRFPRLPEPSLPTRPPPPFHPPRDPCQGFTPSVNRDHAVGSGSNPASSALLLTRTPAHQTDPLPSRGQTLSSQPHARPATRWNAAAAAARV